MTRHPVLQTLSDAFRGWRRRRLAMAELRDLTARHPDALARTAGECGLSTRELKQVVARGTGSDALMHRMMTVYGLDAELLAHDSPELMRDIELACSLCSAKRRCASTLKRTTARAEAGGFCPNADQFAELSLADTR
ncbi:hypothetical protein GN330_11925 [Nitratireductor sp. CAU 1489]|uniref:DUF6455 domain-containing protein n=1 Tax=Nitratireductor arenosus TaxID=2682096 RepID=A0A844QIV4_9HYPH|nr:DUF6455 family protein [Nitratireductor arenosus]MVA97953.1 hypothetical protein [Nitratireductor arenosus]